MGKGGAEEEEELKEDSHTQRNNLIPINPAV